MHERVNRELAIDKKRDEPVNKLSTKPISKKLSPKNTKINHIKSRPKVRIDAVHLLKAITDYPDRMLYG